MAKLNHNTLQALHWDKIATYSQMLPWKEVPFPAKKEMREFFRFINFGERKCILEIGCGRGRYTLPLLRKGHDVMGTDLSQKQLSLLKNLAAKEGLSKNLRLEKNTFEDKRCCQKYKEKFDFALMVAVIHHLNPATREKIFQNIVSCVKKDGWVVALEPNPLNPLYYCLYFWRWLNDVQSVNRWTTEKGMLYTNVWNLKKLFRKSSLSEIQVKRYAFLPSVMGSHFRFILTLNDFLTRVKVIKEFSAFIWIKGKKQ